MLHISCMDCPYTSNVLFTPSLKHSSHLFKAQFSGNAGSCFLKVRAASLVCPHKVTQQVINTSDTDSVIIYIHMYADSVMDGNNYTVEKMYLWPLTIHLCLPKLTSGLTFVRSVIIGSVTSKKKELFPECLIPKGLIR